MVLTDLLDAQLGGAEVAEEGNAELGAPGALTAEVGASGVAMVRTGLQQEGLHNGTRLCEAVGQCLRMSDVDAQEKAVLALHKLWTMGVLENPADACRGAGVVEELEKLQRRCGQNSHDGSSDNDGFTAEGCAAVDALRMAL